MDIARLVDITFLYCGLVEYLEIRTVSGFVRGLAGQFFLVEKIFLIYDVKIF